MYHNVDLMVFEPNAVRQLIAYNISKICEK